MRYILRTKRNLEFYISKSVVGSDTGVVILTLFCEYGNKFINIDENHDSHHGKRI